MDQLNFILDKLTWIDYRNIVTHVITVGLIIKISIWLDRYRTKIDKDNKLNDWIIRARNEKASKEHKPLTEADVDQPLYLSAKETRDQILSKQLNPKKNVVFLAKRCRQHNQDRAGVNAIAEELYDEAYEEAGTLDFSKDTKNSPLFGVAICVKEQHGVKGCYSTGGLACRLGPPHEPRMKKDCLLVELLRKADAIPICTGNTIQLMMLPESYNRIWGRSKNPWDLSRTCGGSSGGDAALVAMGCVPLSCSSDVAGSVRIPACFCGVVGFKPTSIRLTGKGSMKPRKDNKQGTAIAIPATAGPIARTVEDCVLFMKAICTPDLWKGANVPPVPFDEKICNEKGKLKIGYFKTDGWFDPCAASKRGLNETIDALTKEGHECVPFEMPTDGWYNYGLLVNINAAEGNFKSFIEALEGEDLVNEYTTLVRASSVPNWLRAILCKVLDKRRAHLLGNSRNGGLSVFELWKKTADLMAMRQTWADAFNEAGIDALVFPGMPVPAYPHSISGDLTSSVSYMFLSNLLLWPCGAVPVTTVRPDEQHYRMEDLPENQRDKQARLTNDLVMKNSAGMPLSVSVMTPAWSDEKCLRVMKEIERLVDFKERPTAFEEF